MIIVQAAVVESLEEQFQVLVAALVVVDFEADSTKTLNFK